MYFGELPHVAYLHSEQSYLHIYRLFKPKRIGNMVITIGSPSGSNDSRAIPEDTPQNILRYLNALAFCQYQLDRPTVDYPLF